MVELPHRHVLVATPEFLLQIRQGEQSQKICFKGEIVWMEDELCSKGAGYHVEAPFWSVFFQKWSWRKASIWKNQLSPMESSTPRFESDWGGWPPRQSGLRKAVVGLRVGLQSAIKLNGMSSKIRVVKRTNPFPSALEGCQAADVASNFRPRTSERKYSYLGLFLSTRFIPTHYNSIQTVGKSSFLLNAISKRWSFFKKVFFLNSRSQEALQKRCSNKNGQ